MGFFLLSYSIFSYVIAIFCFFFLYFLILVIPPAFMLRGI